MTTDRFRAALQRVIELVPFAEDEINVMLRNDQGRDTCLGRFADYTVAEQHRQAVIDAVLRARTESFA